MKKGYEIRPIEERFWEKVDKSEDCWEWTAGKNNKGYGFIGGSSGGKYKNLLAHRVSYELSYGIIPNKLLVLHKCDNPSCVNPSHLFLGTQTDNMRDMSAKGRHPESKKTHCIHGHPLAGYNLIQSKKQRHCRTCISINIVKSKERRKLNATQINLFH